MIVLLLTTKNESGLLRLNIEHHLRWGVDRVCVADNASTDDTADVVRAFGDAVSSTVFGDFGERQRVRTAMFRDLCARFGRVDWAGVSDTDEFWWAPGATAADLLATVPRGVPAATFGQKLFLPTEVDPCDGPVTRRMLHRASGPESPLFSGYKEGKTFYRGETLHRVSHEHRNPDVAAPEWRHATAAVHHYMIQDEDQFVMKVRRFPAWQPRARPASRWLRALRPAGVAPSAPALKADIKKRWWDVWERGGEPALREHYRTQFRVRRDDVDRHVASGALVRDTAFADHCAAERAICSRADSRSPGLP
jgi:hypothetical protein